MRPYGYDTTGKEIREPEATVLRRAADLVLSGESLRKVVAALNEEGHRTSGGHPWQPVTLRRVLLSPRVAGLRHAGGKLVAADWPPIIDRVTRGRLVKTLGAEARKTTAGPPARRVYLLTGGVGVCALCGKPLVARPNDNGKRGYVCATGEPYRGCGKIRCLAEPLEEYVSDRVVARVVKRSWARESVQAQALERGKVAAEQIRDADRLLSELGEDYADGRIGRTEFHAATARIKERVKIARAEIERVKALEHLAGLGVEDVVDWWNDADPATRRAVLYLVVDRVEVGPATNRGSREFDPSRVTIRWR